MISVFAIFAVVALSFFAAKRDIVNRFFACSLVCVLLIPYEVFSQSEYLGVISKVSPFSFFVFFFYFLSYFFGNYRNALTVQKSIVPLLILFLYVTFLTISNNTGKGFGTIFDNYLAILLACNFLSANKHRMCEVNEIFILKLLLISSFYIIIEFLLSYNPIYFFIFSNAEWAESQWWFDSYRSTGGIGHPLIVATIYLIFLSLIFNLNLKLNLKIALYAIVVFTIVCTGSRAGFFLAFIFSVYLIFSKNKIDRSLIYLFVSFFIASQLYVFGFFDSMIYRIFNSEGSTAVRLALISILNDVFDIGIIGNGIGTTAEFVEQVNFYNAIEVTWVSFVIEIGFLGLFLFFYSWFYFIKYNQLLKVNYAMIFLLFFMVSSNNSLVVHTPIMFVFSLFAFWNWSSHKSKIQKL